MEKLTPRYDKCLSCCGDYVEIWWNSCTLKCALFLLEMRIKNPEYEHRTGGLISPKPDQEGNKLQRQKILSFIYPIYNHNWRNISTIYIYNKTSIKRNILTIKQNTSGSRSG